MARLGRTRRCPGSTRLAAAGAARRPRRQRRRRHRVLGRVRGMGFVPALRRNPARPLLRRRLRRRAQGDRRRGARRRCHRDRDDSPSSFGWGEARGLWLPAWFVAWRRLARRPGDRSQASGSGTAERAGPGVGAAERGGRARRGRSRADADRARAPRRRRARDERDRRAGAGGRPRARGRARVGARVAAGDRDDRADGARRDAPTAGDASCRRTTTLDAGAPHRAWSISTCS